MVGGVSEDTGAFSLYEAVGQLSGHGGVEKGASN